MEKEDLVGIEQEVDRSLAMRYAPPAVLVDADLDVVASRGETGAYLRPPQGDERNLVKLLREGLSAGVRDAIQRAARDKAPSRVAALKSRAAGSPKLVDVTVVPIRSRPRGHVLLVIFEESSRAASPGGSLPAKPDELVSIRRELLATREYLLGVIEEQEAVNRYLRGALDLRDDRLARAAEQLTAANAKLDASERKIAVVLEQLENLQSSRGPSDD